MKNYYKILGIPPDSPQAEIKKAYRTLAVKYHPDKNNGDSSSEERFKEIVEAYLILGDAAKRNAYDFAKGYRKDFRAHSSAKGEQTASTFLILFKKIKERVYHANGHINQAALFKVIDDLLSDKNIDFLLDFDDTATNSLIIDEILTSCIFLDDKQRAGIHNKLLVLANGNAWIIDKINALKEITRPAKDKPVSTGAEKPTVVSVVIFVLATLLIIVLLLASYF